MNHNTQTRLLEEEQPKYPTCDLCPNNATTHIGNYETDEWGIRRLKFHSLCWDHYNSRHASNH